MPINQSVSWADYFGQIRPWNGVVRSKVGALLLLDLNVCLITIQKKGYVSKSVN